MPLKSKGVQRTTSSTDFYLLPKEGLGQLLPSGERDPGINTTRHPELLCLAVFN
jgi:hypothetical protein